VKKNYDFSNAVKNPYAKRLKRQLTLKLDQETIDYFQELANDLSLPYQTLMNMYLRECAISKKRLRLHWKPDPKKSVAA
jgi:uncharacterized protein (DUF4415 family)